MRKNRLLGVTLRGSPNHTSRLSGLRTTLLGQLERNRRTRSYRYESVDLVQPDLSKDSPSIPVSGATCELV